MVLEQMLKRIVQLQIGSLEGPNHQHRTYVKLRSYVDFEPFGRASETWDTVWEVELPQYIAHWRSTTGWRQCSTQATMKFIDRTPLKAANKALSFLMEIREQEEQDERQE